MTLKGKRARRRGRTGRIARKGGWQIQSSASLPPWDLRCEASQAGEEEVAAKSGGGPAAQSVVQAWRTRRPVVLKKPETGEKRIWRRREGEVPEESQCRHACRGEKRMGDAPDTRARRARPATARSGRQPARIPTRR
jgi:hypothetical protein